MNSQKVALLLLMFVECFSLLFIMSFSILVQTTQETINFKKKKKNSLRINNKIFKIFTYTFEDGRHLYEFSLQYCLKNKSKIASHITFKPLL